MAAQAWRIGTRGSRLALAQAEDVIDRLRRAFPDDRFERAIVQTIGDADKQRSFAAFNQIGIFVKELERALLDGAIDAAVHSCKDVPTVGPAGLTLAAFPERQFVHDVLLTKQPYPDDLYGLPQLPANARVGTASVRRRAQLLDWRADLDVTVLRGNIDTRLRKLFDEALDAIVLAAPGIARLYAQPGMDALLEAGGAWTLPDGRTVFVYPLNPRRFVPAPGQGALAVQARRDHDAVLAKLAAVNDADTAAALTAERAFLAGMGSTCEVPIGAYATVEHARVRLLVYYLHLPDRYLEAEGPVAEAEALGADLAQQVRALSGMG